MGIWDRLGNVVKSYLNDTDREIRWRSSSGRRARTEHTDPDVEAAYEELDEFLRGESAPDSDGRKTAGSGKARGAGEKKAAPVPEDIKKDFAELGLAPEASAEQCKEAYKRLLKIHHPDRHANHPGNLKKATEKTARVNAAYERLENWFRIR